MNRAVCAECGFQISAMRSLEIGCARVGHNVGGADMDNINIKDYILKELSREAQSAALSFVLFLEENGITFYKDNGACWKDKIYYWCKFNDECIAFISIKDPDEPQNLWTVWSCDMKSEWFDSYNADDEIKTLAWKHIDLCRDCGSCGGGRHKTVFGRNFGAVCGCTFRADNPNAKDIEFLKQMVKLCMNSST